MKNLNTELRDLKLDEIDTINGGGFAYDVGFFIRAVVLGGGNGVIIASEYVNNYNPVQ